MYKMLNRLRFLPSVFKKSPPPKLGRWNRNHEKRKIDLANHDHCGGPTCLNTKLTKSTDTHDNSMDIAICALQSFHVNPSAR